MTLQWDALPGKPMIGWCEGCDFGVRDLLFQRLKPDENLPAIGELIEPTLVAIAARGPDRWRGPGPYLSASAN